jgi:hypothetical protein
MSSFGWKGGIANAIRSWCEKGPLFGQAMYLPPENHFPDRAATAWPIAPAHTPPSGRNAVVMRGLRMALAAMLMAGLLAGCGGLNFGVDRWRYAYDKGCVPVSGGVSCTGD